MTMPRMNGEEAFLAIKELDPDARVILMSGYTEQDATDRFSGESPRRLRPEAVRTSALRAAVRQAMEGPSAG